MQKQKTLDGEVIDIERRLRPSSFYNYARDEDFIEMPYMIQLNRIRVFGRPKTETKLTDYGIEV